MIKCQKIIVLVFLMLSYSLVQASDTIGYISDDLTLNGLAGPGEQYKIIAQVKAGQQVTIIDNSNGNYTLLRNERGRQFWVPSNKVSPQPSLKMQTPALKAKVEELSQQLANINDDWQKKTRTMSETLSKNQQQLSQLTTENSQLRNELNTSLQKIDTMHLQLNDKQRQIILQWFMYGGGVAGIGLLVGLILAALIMRKRPKKQWHR